jgi:hypothetical protein
MEARGRNAEMGTYRCCGEGNKRAATQKVVTTKVTRLKARQERTGGGAGLSDCSCHSKVSLPTLPLPLGAATQAYAGASSGHLLMQDAFYILVL